MWGRILLGLFLFGHGFVHLNWRTYGPRTSWLLPGAGAAALRGLGATLFVLAAVGFFGATLGVFIQQGWWRPVAVASSMVSLLLLALFWNRGLIVGAAIDLAILIALLWAHWPPASRVGS